MKYFVIESILKNPDIISDDIMKEHISYTQKAINENLILISGLKSDMNGSIFMMKSNSIEDIENYLNNEPFKKYNIQDYKITEFSPHYFNSSNKWFVNENKEEQ